MKPGDLVQPACGDCHLYKDVNVLHRIFVRTFASSSFGVCLDIGFSHVDVPYAKVLVDGVIGWARTEKLKVVR